MSGFESTIQRLFLESLKGDVSVYESVDGRIYDDVPQDTEYPYIVIGEDISTDESTDDGIRRISSLVVHIWSRYRGKKEVKEIQGLIELVLNRAELTDPEYDIVGIHLEQTDSFLDQDGLTRHGSMSFRSIMKRN